MIIRCPHCQHEQTVSPSLNRREVSCPSCQRRYLARPIPPPAAASAARRSGGFGVFILVILLISGSALGYFCWQQHATPWELAARWWPHAAPETPPPVAPPIVKTPSPKIPVPITIPEKPAEAASSESPGEIVVPPFIPPPFDYLAWLLADPTRWPHEVTLREPAQFAIKIDGQDAGSVTLPPGSIVTLERVEKDHLVASYRQDSHVIPIETTDLLARARAGYARAEALLAYSALMRTQHNGATPVPASSPPPRNDATPSATFVHPGLPLTREDLDQLKKDIDREPWKSAYEAFAADGHSQLSYKMRGPFASVSRTPDTNLPQYKSDMQAVYNLALMWSFTGKPAYAQKSHDILVAWAQKHKTFGGAEMYLSMGDYAYRTFGGADILRGTWPGWTKTDTDLCKAYFADTYWAPGWIAVPAPLRSANQGILQLATAMGVAVFNDDPVKFQQCLQAFRADAGGGLADSLPNGEIGDSGRDQGHAYGELQHLTWIAEIAWKQGVDLYAEGDNRLLAAGEFYARYNLGVPTPFMPFGSVYDIYPSHGGAPNSSAKQPDILDMLYSAYVTRKGLSAPYIARYRETRTEGGESFMYRKSSDHSTATPPPPLVYPKTQSVSTGLASVNIGGATPGGNTGYAAGTWTVTGGGGDIGGPADSFRFAYLPLTGDGAIIAEVVSVEKTAGDAKAGLVIRESASSASSDMIGVYVLPETTMRGNTGPRINVNMRGNTASSHHSNGQTHRMWDGTTITIPYWLKLERIGNRITAYHSPDGANWSAIQCADFKMDGTVYAGLAVASRRNGTPNTSTFAHVRITGGNDGEALARPSAPFAIYASPGARQVPLRWLTSLGAASYNVKRGTSPGGPYQTIANTPATSYLDKTVDSGKTYYYVVSAVNTTGESPASKEDTVTPE